MLTVSLCRKICLFEIHIQVLKPYNQYQELYHLLYNQRFLFLLYYHSNNIVVDKDRRYEKA